MSTWSTAGTVDYYLANGVSPDKLVVGVPFYGKEYVADLLKQDRGKAVKEIEAVFEQAAEKYGDVKLDSETIADRAKAELFEIRHLSVGKEAQEIEGMDQDD